MKQFFCTQTNSRIRLIVALAAVLLLAACSNQVEVQVQFANTNDIKAGSPVYFDSEVVGEVSDVEVEGLGSSVMLSLDPQVATRIDGNAAVVVNRLKVGTPLEIFSRTANDDAGLQAGQQLKGLDSMLELGAWMVADAIDLGAGTVAEYVESFQDYLQSDEFAENRALINQQISQAKGAASNALAQAQAELNRAAEDLTSSEQSLAEAMSQLGDELAPLAESLAGSGAQLSKELEEFAVALEEGNANNQQLGEEFLASLLETLDRINQSLEKGANQEQQSDSEQQDGSF